MEVLGPRLLNSIALAKETMVWSRIELRNNGDVSRVKYWIEDDVVYFTMEAGDSHVHCESESLELRATMDGLA
ncbi:unnamed protein product [Haemonchus placei]|uniref:Fn3_like domain-containing protein n=1 Tax=Haemonchus placei TaxID=6290 RepID=A0A0N4WEN2_HAEPC|nr:unnamed protein product [Haemonchus placei]